jgi:uncharacterized membrane protein
MLGTSRFVHKVPAMVLVTGTALVLSMILAPATLPNGSVVGLNARANAMDHWDRWGSMDPFHMAAYTFGDFNCHQRMERTLIINGNEMPVCARDISIFVGLMFGAAILARSRVTDSPIGTFMDLLPDGVRRKVKGKWRAVIVLFILGLLFVPTALDGGVQMLSAFPGSPLSYESTNAMRILTGFPMGIALGAVGTVMLMTLFSRRDDGETPLIRLRNSRS